MLYRAAGNSFVRRVELPAFELKPAGRPTSGYTANRKAPKENGPDRVVLRTAPLDARPLRHAECDAYRAVLFSLMFMRKECPGLEHETLRVDQIVARILLGQAVDSSPRFSQTSNLCDTGKVTVWKSFEDIKCRIHLESRGKRAYFWS